MYRKGHGDNSRHRRRGNARRKQCIGVLAAMLVIYIVYRSFTPDADNRKYESLKSNRLSQKMLVQGEMRNQAPRAESQYNVRADLNGMKHERGVIVEDKNTEANDKKSDDKGGKSGDGDSVQPLSDRNHQAKSFANDLDQNKVTHGNRTNLQINTSLKTDSPQKIDSFASQNKGNISDNFAESNSTFTKETAQHMNPFVPHSIGNVFSNATFSNTSSKQINDLTNGIVDGDIEKYKLNLKEEFVAQTKQLEGLMKETLAKTGTKLLDLKSQNSTDVDGNMTKIVKSLSTKTQNVLNLAKDLLRDRNSSVTNQENSILNNTKLEQLFTVESQELVKMASDLFLKTSKTDLEARGDSKAEFLDTYAFHAQKLRKFASSLLPNTTVNTTVKAVEKQQKLMNIKLPENINLPVTVRNLTERITD